MNAENFTNSTKSILRERDAGKMVFEIRLIEKTLSIINLGFIVFGTVGNLLTFLILMRKNVFKHSCMRFLAVLCILDTLCLYTWNFSMVYSMFFRKKIEHEGAIFCRFFSFFSYFILQSSSWTMCAIGIDRLVTVLVKSTNKLTKFVRNTKFIVFLVIFICFCFNMIVLINNAEPVEQKPNRTVLDRTYTCYEPRKFFVIWDIVHIFMYSLIPFSIIFFQNIILAYLTTKHAKKMNAHRKNLSYPSLTSQQRPIIIETNETISTPQISTFRTRLSQRLDKSKRVYRKNVNIHECEKPKRKKSKLSRAKSTDKSLKLQAKRNKKMQSKGSHVTNLLLFLTVSFFFTTVPYSLFYALKLNIDFDFKTRNIVIGILALLQYFRHAANFLIYLFTSSIIKNELKTIFQSIGKKIF